MSSELKNFEFSKPATPERKSAIVKEPKKESVPEPMSVENEDNEKKGEGEDQKKVKYSSEELMAIFDEILFTGEYVESVTIKNKLTVTFRTRTSKESGDIALTLDTLGANLFQTLEQKRAMLNLQHSLIRYHSKDLSTWKDKEKEDFIGKLPTAITVAMINALSKFDEKVFEACKEAEEGF